MADIWFIAIAGNIPLATSRLKSECYDVYVPMREVLRKQFRREVLAEIPVFYEYVFVGANEVESACKIAGTPGVVHLLSVDGVPATLSHAVIADLRQREVDGEFVAEKPREGPELPEVGTQARIYRGTLKGHVARVVRLVGVRVAVMETKIGMMHVPIRNLKEKKC